MLRPVRTSFFGLALTFLGLLISPSLCGAENPAWNNLKQLSSGQQVRVVLKGKKSFKGQFQSVTDDAVIIRTNGTVAPCFPMYGATHDWGNIEEPKFDAAQLTSMKKTCQQHCFSTLNHNLAYCYNDARVIRFLWTQAVKNRMKGGARSFDH